MNQRQIAAIGCTSVLVLAGGMSVASGVRESYQRDRVADREIERAADEDAVRGAISGYIDSFYLNDASLFDKAVHPNLKKRDVLSMGGTEYLNEMTWSELMAMTPIANRGQWDAGSKKEIEVFDIEHGIASGKLTVGGWIDYFHLAELNGEWKIVNVMWATIPAEADAGD